MIPPIILPPEYTAAQNVRTASEAGWDYTQLVLVREVGDSLTRTKAFVVIEREGGFILGRGRVTGAEEIVQRLCEPSGKRGESESGESTAFKSRTRDISDILEIPQTQEQCGRNGAYDEALDLELYAERLRASLPDVPVIDDLRESARMTNKKMLKKLLVRLQEPIQLPHTTMIGALTHFISEAPSGKFKPMPPTFGLLPVLPEKIKDKRRRYGAYRDRALNDLLLATEKQESVDVACPA